MSRSFSGGKLCSLKWHLFHLHQMNHPNAMNSSIFSSCCLTTDTKSVKEPKRICSCLSLLKPRPQHTCILSHSHSTCSAISLSFPQLLHKGEFITLHRCKLAKVGRDLVQAHQQKFLILIGIRNFQIPFQKLLKSLLLNPNATSLFLNSPNS